ncbi:MAG: SRPBCC domain-containing protein [Rhodococcus sp. (in: high G+C Gram-positive bacteria)]
MTQTTGPSLDLTSPNATSPDLASLDLTVTRLIEAPKSVVWAAWTTPSQLEQRWVPSPSRARVVELDLRAGGAFTTEISAGAGEFVEGLDDEQEES